MSKVAAIINSLDEASNIKDYIDAYLVPLKDLSINYINTFSLKEIEAITKFDKEVFVVINKNIHNNELSLLEQSLKEVDKLKVNGIIFYDIALVNIKNKLGLQTPLVWNQEHLSTNYGTVNYWYKKSVEYAYLSSELTKREIDEIQKIQKPNYL